MATTCSVSRIAVSGLAQPTLKTTGANPAAALLAKVTLPATSVSDGMVCDVSTYLKTKCYGGRILGRAGTKAAKYAFDLIPSTSYTSSNMKIRVTKMTSGVLLSAANDLSGESLIVEFVGY